MGKKKYNRRVRLRVSPEEERARQEEIQCQIEEDDRWFEEQKREMELVELEHARLLAEWEAEDKRHAKAMEELDRMHAEGDRAIEELFDAMDRDRAEIQEGFDQLGRSIKEIKSSRTVSQPAVKMLGAAPIVHDDDDDSATLFTAKYTPDKGIEADKLELPKFKGVEFTARKDGFRFRIKFGH